MQLLIFQSPQPGHPGFPQKTSRDERQKAQLPEGLRLGLARPRCRVIRNLTGTTFGTTRQGERGGVCKNPNKNGAPGETRTLDQLIKSQLLYQLSYRGNRLIIRHLTVVFQPEKLSLYPAKYRRL